MKRTRYTSAKNVASPVGQGPTDLLYKHFNSFNFKAVLRDLFVSDKNTECDGCKEFYSGLVKVHNCYCK